MTIKDKPSTMSVREWLTKKLSLDMVISQKTIEAVISHQFDGALEASYINNSIEISGFGVFHFNKNKALKILNVYEKSKQITEDKLKDETLTEKQKSKLEYKMEMLNSEINYLKSKTQENEQSIE